MNLSPLPIQKFFDNNGEPLVGGLLFTYVAGTTTKIATYTDSTGGSTNTNPVVLDYRGEARVWLDITKTYKFVLSPRGDTDPPTKAITTVDNIAASVSYGDLTQQFLGAIIWPRTTAEIAASITPSNYGYPPYNVLRYGADPTGAADSTDAFNAATAASATHTGNDTIYKREVIVPGGAYKLGAGDKSVYVRKGQHLRGAGIGATYIDVTGTSTNVNPIIVMGKNASGADPGGLFSEVSEMIFLGGPTAAAVVYTDQAGWSVHDIMFSSSGIGVQAGGGDGFISQCFFDEGLTGLLVSGQNHTIIGCAFYLMNNQIQVNPDCFDVNIDSCQFEYPQNRSIFLADGATNIKNLSIRGCNFTMNQQYAGHIAYIGVRSVGADIFIGGGCTFRNGKAAAVSHETGVGNIIVMDGFLIDGNKTNPAYTQGTTSQGVVASNMDVTMRNGVLRNLTAQPITFAGTVTSKLLAENIKIENCTGGTTDISITNNQTTSTFALTNISGSGRRLFNSQGTVPVTAKGLRNWLAPIATSGASHFVLVPYQESNAYQVCLRANLNSGGSANYRKTKLVFVQKDNDFSGTAKSFVNFATAVEGAANLNGLVGFVAEFGSVGGGTNIASSNFGDLAFSWPNTYTSESIDVQIVQ
jgi:hypothetical protein